MAQAAAASSIHQLPESTLCGPHLQMEDNATTPKVTKGKKRNSTPRFDCYRDYHHDWVGVSSHAANIMFSLPAEGPISYAMFFAAVSACLHIKPELLGVPSRTIEVTFASDGKRALHVTAKGRTAFFNTWYKMCLYADEWSGLEVGMDLSSAVANAYSVNAVSMATSEASKKFSDEKLCTPSVTINLTRAQELTLLKEIDIKVQFQPKRMNTTDHPLLAATRELIRQSYDSQFKVRQSSLKTLVVGAAHREVAMYQSKENFSYYFALKEPKDVSRINMKFLDMCKKEIVTGLEIAKKRAVNKASGKRLTSGLKKKVEGIAALLEETRVQGKIPGRFYTELPVYDRTTGENDFDQLLLEDVGYNFTAHDWLDLFDWTNADVAIGYMLLPLELVFENMAPNNMYIYRERDVGTQPSDYARGTPKEFFVAAAKGAIRNEFIPDSIKQSTKLAQLAYPGYSNGYSHKKTAWATLLKETVIARPGYDFGLHCEITGRIGPMATFRVERVTSSISCVRYLTLGPTQKFVRVLDIIALLEASKKLQNLILVSDYPYFSVRQEEWLDAVNYAASLDEKSTTIQNLMVYIRRRAGGASLVSKELLPAWTISDAKHSSLAIAVFYYVKTLRKKMSEADDTVMKDAGSWWRKLANVLCQPVFVIAGMVSLLFSWMWSNGVCDRIVLTPEMGFWQDSGAVIFGGKTEKVYNLYDDDTEVELPKCVQFPDLGKGASVYDNADKSDVADAVVNVPCDLCLALEGNLGLQCVRCSGGSPTYHDFALTDSQVSELRTQLMNIDNDPQGLGAVKTNCKQHLPVSGFSHRARVHYIMGGPGTGKSYVIRKLAKVDDCVLAPFSKLKSDYVDVDTADGYKKDLSFKTPHRAVCETNHAVIFVDEFPAFPYELMACAVYNCSAEVVYLVGDINQTKIREPTEGMCAVNHIDFANIQTHTLVKNFRNPADAVNILNGKFNYRMESASGQTSGFFYDSIANIGKYSDGYSIITYTEAVGKSLDFEEKNTVRANQGSTHERVALVLTDSQKLLMEIPELTIVALSRHKKECVFLHDASAASLNFLVGLGLVDSTDLVIGETNFGKVGKQACLQPVPKLAVSETPSTSTTKEIVFNTRVVDYTTYKKSYSDYVLREISNLGEVTKGLKIAVALDSAMVDSGYITTEKMVGIIKDHLEVVIITDESSSVRNFIEKFEFGQTYADHVTQFVGDIRTLATIGKHVEEEPKVVIKAEHPGFDAFLLLQEELNAGRLEYQLPYINKEAANVVESDFGTGVIDTGVIAPVNMRGHPVKQEITVYKFTTGPALQYYANDQWQLLQCLQARYLFKGAKMLYEAQGEKFAQDIGNRFYNECMSTNYRAFGHEDIATVVDTAYANMVSKNYEKQVDLTDGGSKARTCRFNLKQIDKPIKNMLDLFKAGQGISAWSKEAHTLFCLGFRVLNQAFISSLNKNVVYDNGLSEEETMHQVGQILAATPDVAVNAVIDAAACDSGQNKFTMQIERQIYKRMGASELFLDWYFSFRESYRLDSGFVKANIEFVKTSGEPGTLLGNTVLMMALMNSILRGEGEFAMVGKGDDGLKRQANMRHDPKLVSLVQKQCPLQFKVDINVPIQFCGYALVGNQLVPCILRKLIKCASHGFQDYEHFAEYQKSLRDWMNRVSTLMQDGVPVIETNMSIYNVNSEVANMWLSIIDSLSHINKTQFYLKARPFRTEFEVPQYDHTLPSSVFKFKQSCAFTDRSA